MLRRSIAGAVVAGSLVLGAGGAALAHDAPTTPELCERFERRLDALARLEARLEAKEVRQEARLARAESAGRDRLAQRIEAHLAQTDRQQARVAAKVARVQAHQAEHCSVEVPTS